MGLRISSAAGRAAASLARPASPSAIMASLEYGRILPGINRAGLPATGIRSALVLRRARAHDGFARLARAWPRAPVSKDGGGPARGPGSGRPRASRRNAVNRDRGEPRGSAPPTPPYVRVRIRRFGGLSSTLGHQGCDAKRGEEGLREGNVERGAVAQPPGAM